MNKAQRLLTIYTHLLNNQGVNKMNLADELEVDERTIQGDIEDIRNYLFDNDDFQQRMEVTYQHKSNEYRLIRHSALLDSNVLSILIMHLKNHSSVISRDMYELLKSIIYKFYSHDTKQLLQQINMFHVVEEEKSTLTVLSILQGAIHQQNTIKFKYHGEEIVGTPIQITSTHNQYKLWLKKSNRQFHIKNIKSLQTTDAEISNPEKVILKMTKDVWHVLKDQYSVDVIESISDNQFTVSFYMTYPEVLTVCMMYSPHIMLISPSYMYLPLVNFILAINAVYMNQQIQINNESKEIDNEEQE